MADTGGGRVEEGETDTRGTEAAAEADAEGAATEAGAEDAGADEGTMNRWTTAADAPRTMSAARTRTRLRILTTIASGISLTVIMCWRLG
jgi:hypothetical protein